MKTLFDLIATQPSIEAKFHGGSDYAIYIFIKALQSNYSNFDAIYNPDLELPEKVKKELKQHNIKLIPAKNNAEIKAIINQGKYHTFYSAHPYNFIDFDFKTTKFIMTIHGLRQVETPHDKYQFKYPFDKVEKLKFRIKNTFFRNRDLQKFKRLTSIQNKHIITVSQHTKHALCYYFPSIKLSEIDVHYSPVNYNVQEEPKKSTSDYYLLVSTNRWIKNNYRAIKALDILFSQNKLNGKQVIALGSNNLKFKSELKNPDRFKFVDYVSEQDLNDYFRNAFCFIYPSLNEGFGYPPVQAMLHNTPVIASAVTSIPEVCEKAALYFNPLSIPEIANRILQIDENKMIREKLINEGKKRINELAEIQSKSIENLLKLIFENKS